MATPVTPIADEAVFPVLGDELLELIFLRLPTPSDLARASTACPSFRRIITQRSFLRRFRKLHPPPLLGLVADKGAFHPVQAPNPSAPLARALVDGADFSYSFVPRPSDGLFSPWSPRDVQDGRVLLECTSFCREEGSEIVFTNLAVCDPVWRRYVLLPPVPKVMSVQQERLVGFVPILAPLVGDEDETSFKLMHMACYETKLVTFVFSSVSGQWCISASPTWNSLGTDVPPGSQGLSRFNYESGCFYWTDLWTDKLLVLDMSRMEFSTVYIISNYHMQLHINEPDRSICMPTIVVGTECAVEMLTLFGNASPTGFNIYRVTQHCCDESSSSWRVENVMALPRRCLYLTVGAAQGFLFIRGVREPKRDDNDQDVDFFSLDVKTSELQKVCRTGYFNPPNRVRSYFGFPPSLSKPSI